MKGSVGCVVDPELSLERLRFGDSSGYFRNYSSQGPNQTPDTSFYQWVPFILILQAALFYIPRKIWKSCEGGLIASFGIQIRFRQTFMSVTSGKDARRLVILKGDLENSGDRGSLVKEDIAKKYITYFHSILHHNNGYFCLVMKPICIKYFYDHSFFSFYCVRF